MAGLPANYIDPIVAEVSLAVHPTRNHDGTGGFIQPLLLLP